ncbi:MAG: hypothetical protein ABIM21_02870 [candidate division WOR-3 bacterium]
MKKLAFLCMVFCFIFVCSLCIADSSYEVNKSDSTVSGTQNSNLDSGKDKEKEGDKSLMDKIKEQIKNDKPKCRDCIIGVRG